jgi:hypothetical protein
MLLSRLLILLFLLYSAAAISLRADVKPNEPALANVPPTQTDTKLLHPDVLTVANEALAAARAQTAFLSVIATILAIFLGSLGIANWTLILNYDGKLKAVLKESQDLRDESKKLEEDSNARLKRLGQEKDSISKDMDKLMEHQETLRKSSEAILKEVAELKHQEKSLRKLTETVRAATLATSRLSVETRLTSLQRLSQQVDPVGIAPLLEVLKDCENDVSLRLEAAYGLGRYSEDIPSFVKHYPEIFSGLREVLSDPNTPKALASDTIRSARRFRTDSGELIPPFDQLAPLIEKWEQSDAQEAGPAEG